MPILKYQDSLKQKASQLRNNLTPGEIMLWQYLKGKQMLGYAFHRQKPLYYYIVDFYAPKLMLAIEVDGKESHENNEEYDNERQKFLESKGIKFLRFKEIEVRMGIKFVLQEIENYIVKQK